MYMYITKAIRSVAFIIINKVEYQINLKGWDVFHCTVIFFIIHPVLFHQKQTAALLKKPGKLIDFSKLIRSP